MPNHGSCVTSLMRINTVNVNWTAFVVDRETIILVDPHFLLFRVADREIGNVLFAVDVWTRRVCHSAENARLKRDVAFLSELELAGYWTADWHGVSS